MFEPWLTMVEPCFFRLGNNSRSAWHALDITHPDYAQDTMQHAIEGLHDAVRTYTRRILPRCLVSFCMARYRKKKHARTFNLLFTASNDFKFPSSVCANILVTLL